MIKRQIQLSIAATILIACLFWFLQFHGKEQFTTNNQISYDLHHLEQTSALLFNEYMRQKSDHYPNYDRLNQQISHRNKSIEALVNSDQLNRVHHQKTLELLKTLSVEFKSQVSQLRQWQSLHSTLRNSSIYLPSATEKIMASGRFDSQQNITRHLFSINNLLSLSNKHNSGENLKKIAQHLDALKTLSSNYRLPDNLMNNLIAHAELYLEYSPSYTEHHIALTEQQDKLSGLLNRTIKSFAQEDQTEANFIIYLTYIIFIFILMTEGVVILYLKRTEKAMVTDAMTKLPNRQGFEQSIRNDKKNIDKGGFLLLTIRKFGRINHYFSTQAGDHVLREFSQRLLEHYKGTSVEVFRLAGDEFGVLLPEADSEDYLTNAFQNLIEHTAKQAFHYQDLPIHIQLAASSTLHRPFMATAGICLNQVKKNPRINYIHYEESSGLEIEAQKKSDMLHQLRTAIVTDRIEAFFQPIVGLKGQSRAKYECLLRLRKEDGSYISPFFFLDVAKEANYYAALTRIMVEKCFDYFIDKDADFSLNLSAEDIVDESLVNWLLDKLKAQPELCKHISFEVLESEGIENFDAIIQFINQVKSLGCKIAIDDFGSGYSNYENILRLNVDYLKIDGSLIKNIDTDKNSERITASIIDFAHEMGIEVIVEFVHSQSVLDKVRTLNADYAQGFHLGKPEPEIQTIESLNLS